MSANGTVQNIRFGDFEVDFAKQEIRKQGKRIHLQRKPFQILELLLECPGGLVRREDIARVLWPGLHVGLERCLNTAVNNLRQAIGDSSNCARLIETRSGLGYAFVAKVENVIDPDYLKGRYLLDKMTEVDTRKAIAYFESVRAYAALADAHCELSRHSFAASQTCGAKAIEYVDLALGAKCYFAEAQVSLGRVKLLFERDLEAAEAALLRALEINPACAAAHRCYASLCAIRDENEQALKHICTAQTIQPMSLPIAVDLAFHFYLNRDYQTAAEECWKILALEPRFWPAQMTLGLAYEQLTMREEAGAELENSVICSASHPLALYALEHHSMDATRFFGPIRENRAGQGFDIYASDWAGTAELGSNHRRSGSSAVAGFAVSGDDVD